MGKHQGKDATNNFTGLAQIYDRARPGYPAATLRAVLDHCHLTKGATLIDIGCGTGISSRAFANLGLKVIGIEPNGDMRAVAQAANKDAQFAPVYQVGRAECTGLPSSCAHAVAAAQAFHWFDAHKTLVEFARILKEKGWVILMWNERQETDAFTKEYGDLMRSVPGAAEIELDRSKSGGALLASALYERGEELVFANEQILDEKLLVERAFSASYAPREAQAAEKLEQSIKHLFQKHQRGTNVILKYVTNVYLARKVG